MKVFTLIDTNNLNILIKKNSISEIKYAAKALEAEI